MALVSRCHKQPVIIRETVEGSYYVCEKCHRPTDAIFFSVIRSLWDEGCVDDLANNDGD